MLLAKERGEVGGQGIGELLQLILMLVQIVEEILAKSWLGAGRAADAPAGCQTIDSLLAARLMPAR